jgi:hypothetical protein
MFLVLRTAYLDAKLQWGNEWSLSLSLLLCLLPNRLLIGELKNDEFLFGEVSVPLGEETDSFYSLEKSNPLGVALERTMLEYICRPFFPFSRSM